MFQIFQPDTCIHITALQHQVEIGVCQQVLGLLGTGLVVILWQQDVALHASAQRHAILFLSRYAQTTAQTDYDQPQSHLFSSLTFSISSTSAPSV